MKFDVIFPIAGNSSRFNYTFKPFIYLDDRNFIQYALEPFIKYKTYINKVFFIATKQQNEENDVSNRIYNIFKEFELNINIILIDSKTDGPYQTIRQGLIKIRGKSNLPFFVCDCDHSINITPMINCLTLNPSLKCIIPLWNIDNDKQYNWSKILVNSNGECLGIYEKEYIEQKNNEKLYGIIGCYYFNSTKYFKNADYINISEILIEKYSELNPNLVEINEAMFFGTPDMVEKCKENRRKKITILCDIDGVLIEHSPHSNQNPEDNKVIKDTIFKLKLWKQLDYQVILITARHNIYREKIIKMLNHLDIQYHQLITGANTGTRYLINDIKPSNIFTRMSVPFNLQRNEGIDNVNIVEHFNNDISIIKYFKGGSFSKTCLVEHNENIFVRKYYIKNNDTIEHYYKLRRQCEDLRRFYFYKKNIVPQIYDEVDNDYMYYIDMEYMEGYNELSNFPINIQKMVVENIIEDLNDNVYCFKKYNKNMKFIYDFMDEKIYKKLDKFSDECSIMNELINSESVVINNIEYLGLYKCFKSINLEWFNPNTLQPIHGDLNVENILYDGSSNYRLIDMEGSRYVDAIEFDIAKLFQTFLIKYNEWSNLENVIYNLDNLECLDKFFDFNYNDIEFITKKYSNIIEFSEDEILTRGIFYMTTYLIRFVQFRRLISNEHGIFAIIMAIVWLNKLL